MAKARYRAVSVYLVMCILLLSSCALDLLDVQDPHADPQAAIVDLSGPLPVATPASQGFDEERLKRALVAAHQIHGLRSFVVLRNGYLVIDENFTQTGGDTLTDIFAATDIVTTALVGVAMKQRAIHSENDLLMTYLSPDVATLPEDKRGARYEVLRNLNYGYLFWREDRDVNSAFFQWGYAGQFIYCVPDRNLVVVTLAEKPFTVEEARQQENLILEFITHDLLSSVYPISEIKRKSNP